MVDKKKDRDSNSDFPSFPNLDNRNINNFDKHVDLNEFTRKDTRTLTTKTTKEQFRKQSKNNLFKTENRLKARRSSISNVNLEEVATMIEKNKGVKKTLLENGWNDENFKKLSTKNLDFDIIPQIIRRKGQSSKVINKLSSIHYQNSQNNLSNLNNIANIPISSKHRQSENDIQFLKSGLQNQNFIINDLQKIDEEDDSKTPQELMIKKYGSQKSSKIFESENNFD